MDQTITAARDLFYLFSCRLRDIPCDPARLEQMQLCHAVSGTAAYPGRNDMHEL